MAHPINFLLLLFLFSTAKASYNVVSYGAEPDGKTDSAGPFLRAWAAACGANKAANIVVPKGRFFISQGAFHGPCNNTAVSIYIIGSIIAHTVYSSSQTWMVFRYVEGLSIHGGALDGRGAAFWACKAAGKECPGGATTLSINHCKNTLLSGLTLLNSQLSHISIYASEGVTIRNSRIIAPGNSPNTDGIHVGMSTGVTIIATNIKTGDDCISLGPGSTKIWIDGISCGPGHGISIGSLGESLVEAGVQNVTAKRVVFTGTQNGFRIKSWARASHGFVNGASFRHAIMRNVQNPIIIDQNYCPANINCPNNSSGITISNVMYSNIQGTSATPIALKFDCSPRNPCSGIELKDIKLTYRNQTAQSFCENVHGTTSGFVIPPSCF